MFLLLLKDDIFLGFLVVQNCSPGVLKSRLAPMESSVWRLSKLWSSSIKRYLIPFRPKNFKDSVGSFSAAGVNGNLSADDGVIQAGRQPRLSPSESFTNLLSKLVCLYLSQSFRATIPSAIWNVDYSFCPQSSAAKWYGIKRLRPCFSYYPLTRD